MIVCVAAFSGGCGVRVGPIQTFRPSALRTALMWSSGRRLHLPPGPGPHDLRSKTATGYSSTGSALWTFTIHGMFIYDGTMAKATNASYSYQIYDDEWSFKSGNAYCSGSQTIGEATFKGTLFVSQNVTVTLTCSPDGKLS